MIALSIRACGLSSGIGVIVKTYKDCIATCLLLCVALCAVAMPYMVHGAFLLRMFVVAANAKSLLLALPVVVVTGVLLFKIEYSRTIAASKPCRIVACLSAMAGLWFLMRSPGDGFTYLDAMVPAFVLMGVFVVHALVWFSVLVRAIPPVRRLPISAMGALLAAVMLPIAVAGGEPGVSRFGAILLVLIGMLYFGPCFDTSRSMDLLSGADAACEGVSKASDFDTGLVGDRDDSVKVQVPVLKNDLAELSRLVGDLWGLTQRERSVFTRFGSWL